MKNTQTEMALYYTVHCYWVSYLIDAQNNDKSKLRTCAYRYIGRCNGSTPKVVFNQRPNRGLPVFPICMSCRAAAMERKRMLLHKERDKLWDLIFEKYPEIPFKVLQRLIEEKPRVADRYLEAMFADYLDGLVIRPYMISRSEALYLQKLVEQSAQKRCSSDTAALHQQEYDGKQEEIDFDSAVRAVES
jgi:hypothetical protein